MGTTNRAKCRSCGHEFKFSKGGGFNFAIVNCDSCHRAKSISWKEKKESDTHGKCECGGTFTNSAEVRCEKCDSDDIEDLGVELYFD